MNYSKELGKFAEEKASEYLFSLGWKILGRNFSNRYGEIDIIAIDNSENPPELVIIEVRCRVKGEIQSALDSIGPRKLKTLIRSSRAFVEDSEWNGFWRIDAVGITLKDEITIKELEFYNDWELEHIKDITAGMNIFS